MCAGLASVGEAGGRDGGPGPWMRYRILKVAKHKLCPEIEPDEG